MRDYRKLKVWEKAHQFVLEVYRATSAFPREERFGLTREVRRSATSVPSNIAEGCGRESEREFARFLSIAAGSASETAPACPRPSVPGRSNPPGSRHAGAGDQEHAQQLHSEANG